MGGRESSLARALSQDKRSELRWAANQYASNSPVSLSADARLSANCCKRTACPKVYAPWPQAVSHEAVRVCSCPTLRVLEGIALQSLTREMR